jgi:hypothetical protein
MKPYEAHVMSALIAENIALQRHLAMLRTALEPFARKAEAISISEALGHVTREYLTIARHVMRVTDKEQAA